MERRDKQYIVIYEDRKSVKINRKLIKKTYME